MNHQHNAVEKFRSGYACSQAILGTYGPQFGMNETSGLRISSGFAAGMRQGKTCGAVTGAFMVLGLAFADKDCSNAQGRADVYDKISEFSKRFKEKHGDIDCRELLKCDISTSEGLQSAKDKGLFQTNCVDYIKSAASILEGIITEID